MKNTKTYRGDFVKFNTIIYSANQPRDSKFYSAIGPYALSKEVTIEMHDLQYGSLYDMPYANWIILTDNKDDTIGFCAMFEKEKEIFFDNCYVDPKHRGKGYGKELFKIRMNMAKSKANGRKIKGITMNDIQYNIYLKNGFILKSKRGKYYWMEMEG